MIVEKLDHVNIIAADLQATARFYAALLDLEERDGPAHMRPDQVRWMYDSAGNAILHLNSEDFARRYDRDVEVGAPTGAIHHVAFRCKGFDAMRERLDARGADYRVSDHSASGIKQIFTADPNNVLLELNFFDG
ncbi:VOC family protein [Pontixanthobacter aquaemixtae]|uniref:Glyoxalase/bleomycin resistance/extradiol dioxygenase family protein n=1 Tax=Pontixanthobacter aquaemixtae TaxID=1958940 RepID=A0A844ZWH5_9SPHN|nr:VOC family protein [Pontixanthobacter aquaemixtae]MXO91107.1 glyoxalase/bleomycin resistance/extradiol dioxygenase family protein [Pontixanthobacter aquaemixtae]